ncbi:PREDICTED: uncharacterized protein LOC100635691 [Amphimedon queenslandica]|uniref:Laminin G domain-containing protein n=1 Tax=Amphimedon queenslandica TaxID=400682 RepID=A0AAN0J4T8_AMPQE|nr:PREDICTED: uncharacterized protein LOC100635691 [Amphimedon queenslandica]|eukprot:XP_019852025.1 PREDICTED: uncharacterized protein LOC100635691 [Amphimedon queenslandica]
MLLQLVTLLLCTFGLASSQEAYYGYHGYSFFSSGSQVLSRGNESLSISFRSCQSDGLLLYATESSPGTGYFSIGIYQSRILIEFNFGNDLREIIQTGSSLISNSWYRLDLLRLNEGSSGFSLLLNNESLSVQSDNFEGINFEFLDGPLYIGGHPNPVAISVLRLRSTLDACISEVSTPAGSIDLISAASPNVVSSCPAGQCQISTSLTFSSLHSSVSFPLTGRSTSFLKLQFYFQTR